MKLAMLSGAFPPDLDGIGDYTWWLSKTVAEMGNEVMVFTSVGSARKPPPKVKVDAFFNPEDSNTLDPLVEKLNSCGYDCILVQYNPFSYGKRGYCPGLAKVLRRIRKDASAPRIAVMFHETYVPAWPWKNTVMRAYQQLILHSVCKQADVAFISTERWRKQIQFARRSLACHHLPVGSNIPKSHLSKNEAREKIGIKADSTVLGIFGSSHPSRLKDWIQAAVKSVADSREKTTVLYVGADGEEFKVISNRTAFIDKGPLPADEVADCLRAMDLLVSPFVDGVSTRRGSVMAALLNDVKVVTTKREWTDQSFSEIELVTMSDIEGGPNSFIQKTLEALEQKPKPNYKFPFSWEKISKQLLAKIN